MVDQFKGLISDVLNNASYFLFFLFVFVLLTYFAPEIFLDALGAIHGVFPLFIRRYLTEVHITSEQLFSFYYVLSVITTSSLVLFLIKVRIGQVWVHEKILFEKCILVCSYFLLINMILSNLNLPTANLGSLIESKGFFDAIFPSLPIMIVSTFFLLYTIQTVCMIISPERFRDRFEGMN